MDIPFKEYLTGFLSRTRYAKEDLSEKQVEELSESLGVRPEVIWEARLLYRERAHLLGIQIPSKPSKVVSMVTFNSNRKSYQYHAVTLHISKEVKKEVVEYAESRKTNPQTLIRSIIHKYLQGSWEPPVIQDRWWVSGKFKKVAQETSIKTNISHAARSALWMRAEVLRTTSAALVRTLVIDTMMGKFGQPGLLPFVTRTQMFTDVSQYQTRFEQDNVSIPKRLDFAGLSLPDDPPDDDE